MDMCFLLTLMLPKVILAVHSFLHLAVCYSASAKTQWVYRSAWVFILITRTYVICVYIDTECMCFWVNNSVKPLLMAVQNKKMTLND